MWVPANCFDAWVDSTRARVCRAWAHRVLQQQLAEAKANYEAKAKEAAALRESVTEINMEFQHANTVSREKADVRGVLCGGGGQLPGCLAGKGTGGGAGSHFVPFPAAPLLPLAPSSTHIFQVTWTHSRCELCVAQRTLRFPRMPLSLCGWWMQLLDLKLQQIATLTKAVRSLESKLRVRDGIIRAFTLRLDQLVASRYALARDC